MRLRVMFGAYLVLAASLALGSSFGTAAADDEKKPEDKKPEDKPLTYKADVAPLLKDACSSCHSGFRAKARLDVTSYDSVMKFVKAGEPDKSKLHNCLLGKGAKMMPPKNPLADDQIALVKNWIAGGAKKE